MFPETSLTSTQRNCIKTTGKLNKLRLQLVVEKKQAQAAFLCACEHTAYHTRHLTKVNKTKVDIDSLVQCVSLLNREIRREEDNANQVTAGRGSLVNGGPSNTTLRASNNTENLKRADLTKEDIKKRLGIEMRRRTVRSSRPTQRTMRRTKAVTFDFCLIYSLSVDSASLSLVVLINQF